MRANYEELEAVDKGAANDTIALLKRTFVRYKRMNGCNTKGVSKHWDHIWPKLVRVLKSSGVSDVDAYFRAQFELVGTSISPNELASDRALERYFTFKTQEVANKKMKFQLQIHKIQSRLRYRTLKDTLEDTLEDLDPLVRACVAKDADLEDVFLKFKDRAVMQYSMAPSLYDGIYLVDGKDFIPEELREAVKEESK